MYSKRGILGRIQEKSKINMNGCWEMNPSANGYPRFMFNGDAYQAHRLYGKFVMGKYLMV